MKMGLWQPQTLGQVPNVIAVTSVPNGNDTHTHTNTVGGSWLAACNGKSGLYGGGEYGFLGGNILFKKPSEIICLRLTWTSFLRKVGV